MNPFVASKENNVRLPVFIIYIKSHLVTDDVVPMCRVGFAGDPRLLGM